MEICIALTAFHAFSGSLNRKCKVGTLILLEKNESTQRKFSKLNAITEDDIQAVEGLVWAMYSKKRFRSVDELHLELFLKKYKPNNDSLFWQMNSVTLPPSSKVQKDEEVELYSNTFEKLFKC